MHKINETEGALGSQLLGWFGQPNAGNEKVKWMVEWVDGEVRVDDRELKLDNKRVVG